MNDNSGKESWQENLFYISGEKEIPGRGKWTYSGQQFYF